MYECIICVVWKTLRTHTHTNKHTQMYFQIFTWCSGLCIASTSSSSFSSTSTSFSCSYFCSCSCSSSSSYSYILTHTPGRSRESRCRCRRRMIQGLLKRARQSIRELFPRTKKSQLPTVAASSTSNILRLNGICVMSYNDTVRQSFHGNGFLTCGLSITTTTYEVYAVHVSTK